MSSNDDKVCYSMSSNERKLSFDKIKILYKQGMKAYHNNKNREAVDIFLEIMEIEEPTSIYFLWARHNVGCNLITIGRKAEGLKYLKESAQADHPSSLYYYGCHFEQQGDVRAISCYTRAALLGNIKARQALKRNKLSIPENSTLDNTKIHWSPNITLH